jgi:hypothetical protein
MLPYRWGEDYGLRITTPAVNKRMVSLMQDWHFGGSGGGIWPVKGGGGGGGVECFLNYKILT